MQATSYSSSEELELSPPMELSRRRFLDSMTPLFDFRSLGPTITKPEKGTELTEAKREGRELPATKTLAGTAVTRAFERSCARKRGQGGSHDTQAEPQKGQEGPMQMQLLGGVAHNSHQKGGTGLDSRALLAAKIIALSRREGGSSSRRGRSDAKKTATLSRRG